MAGRRPGAPRSWLIVLGPRQHHANPPPTLGARPHLQGAVVRRHPFAHAQQTPPLRRLRPIRANAGGAPLVDDLHIEGPPGDPDVDARPRDASAVLERIGERLLDDAVGDELQPLSYRKP